MAALNASLNKRTPGVPGTANIFLRLRRRELALEHSRSFQKHSPVVAFRHLQVQAVLDPYTVESNQALPQAGNQRAKVQEVIAVGNDLVIVLTDSGLCAAFCSRARKFVRYLNLLLDESIRSMFWNKYNQSLVFCSVHSCDNFSSLRCRSLSISGIRSGCSDASQPLFEKESLRWPGFVEFDDVNGKVITSSVPDRVFKIWDLRNYHELFRITDAHVNEIKISPGVILLIYKRAKSAGHVRLRWLSIDTGRLLKEYLQPLHRQKEVNFIEQFNDHLLVKQEGEALQIYNIVTSAKREVPRSVFMTPSAFMFLYHSHKFLTFRSSSVSVWGPHGELLSTLPDPVVWSESTSNTCITQSQDRILMYCNSRERAEPPPPPRPAARKGGAEEADDAEPPAPPPEHSTGSLVLVDLAAGRRIARIACERLEPPPGPPHPPWRARRCGGSRCWKVCGADGPCPLDSVSAICYSEERLEIYTGSKDGRLYLWA